MSYLQLRENPTYEPWKKLVFANSLCREEKN